ncbi:hypothetical protein Tco_1384063 [Tanacetum coccineum]
MDRRQLAKFSYLDFVICLDDESYISRILLSWHSSYFATIEFDMDCITFLEPLVERIGDRIVDRLSDARNRTGPTESGDSCVGKVKPNSLIPLSRGSFDVLVGMDRLSKRKFGIVCHGKVVRIPLEGDEILRVHGERTQGVVKTLMNTKVVEFRVDLVPGATPVAKSPYRLAPLEMQELSEQLQELQDEEEHGVHLKLELELLRKEKLYAKSSVKDKILATSSETSKVENTPAEMLRDLDQQMEKRADDVGDALSGKERVKSRRVRGMILAAQSEAFKQENILAERVLLVGSVMHEAHASRLRWMIYLVVLADAAKSVRDANGFEYCLASSSGWTKDWKGVVRFGKKGKLALRYVGPFEILERIGLVAYRLRLPEELNSMHDTFHVSNLKRCLADASLHVPLDEIKVDKTLHFVEEPVEIMNREIKSLKCSKISLVKFRQYAGQNVGNQVVQNVVQNLGVQNVGNHNGVIIVPGIANQNGNGNAIAARAEGNAIGNNDLDEIEEFNANCILMANLQQASTSGTQTNTAPVYDSDESAEVSSVEQGGGTVEQHSANVKKICVYHKSLFHNLAAEVEKVNSVNRKMKEKIAELTTELARYKNQERCFEISQEKYDKLERCYQQSVYQEQCLTKKINALHLSSEAAKFVRDFQSLAKEADESLAKHKALELDIECLLSAVISQDIMSIVQNPTVVETSDLQTKLDKLENENVELEFQIKNYAKENAHLKTAYKNLSDSINVTRTHTKAIIDSLQNKLYDTIYKNAKLRAQLFDKVSEQKDTTRGTSANTKFAKQSILRKPPSSSRPKLYVVTPLPKSTAIPKVGESNALSNRVTSNSVPSYQELKVVENDNVIAPGMFRIDPRKTSRKDKFVPNKHVKASVRTKPITVSQPHVITKNNVNSKTNGFSPKNVKSTNRTRRPQPRNNPKNDKVPSKSKSSCLSNNLGKIEENHRNLQSSLNLKHMSSERNNIRLAIRNAKSEVVCAMCKQCLITINHDACVLNYVNDMNSRTLNKNANVSNVKNQKKHKPKVLKPKKVGSKERLASPNPNTPRSCLRTKIIMETMNTTVDEPSAMAFIYFRMKPAFQRKGEWGLFGNSGNTQLVLNDFSDTLIDFYINWFYGSSWQYSKDSPTVISQEVIRRLRLVFCFEPPVTRTASTAAKPCQGDSYEFYLIKGSIYTD